MEKFSCSTCSSSDGIQLECGHIQCCLCSLHLNETNIQCDCCTILPISNEDFGVINVNPPCSDCGVNFGSNAEYEKHKKKEKCRLEKYGCNQQIDLCSMNKHLCDQSHTNALKLGLSRNMESTNNINFIGKLTECLSENDNITNELVPNEETESIDDKLVLDFVDMFTTCQIEYHDNNQMIDQNFFENQLIRSEKVENLIQSRIDQLDVQQNNDQQSYNGSILQEQATVLTMQSQSEEKLNKLSLENQRLKDENYSLAVNRCILETSLSSVPYSKNGLFIWSLENISEEITKSYSNRDYFIDSPKFSSLTDEHLLNVRLFLYGDSSVRPNYISIYIILNTGGNNNLCIPISCCLVDQTINHQHIIRQDRVNLNRDNIGIIYRFLQFVEAINVHKEGSSFVENDTLCLIVKLHENETNQYKHHSPSVQNALKKINSFKFP